LHDQLAGEQPKARHVFFLMPEDGQQAMDVGDPSIGQLKGDLRGQMRDPFGKHGKL
jgi:hypothetical protein